MQTPAPWAAKADVEAARDELKIEISALHANPGAADRAAADVVVMVAPCAEPDVATAARPVAIPAATSIEG